MVASITSAICAGTHRRGYRDGHIYLINCLHLDIEKRVQGWLPLPHHLSVLLHREDTGMAAYTVSIHLCLHTKRIQGWPPIPYPSICAYTQRRGYRDGRLYHTSRLRWFDPSF